MDQCGGRSGQIKRVHETGESIFSTKVSCLEAMDSSGRALSVFNSQPFGPHAKHVRNSRIPLFSVKACSLFGEDHYGILMLSLMPFFILLACSIYTLFLLKVWFAAVDAPIGYEDPRGFHYGMETLKIDSQR
jgi:hypothetical protein